MAWLHGCRWEIPIVRGLRRLSDSYENDRITGAKIILNGGRRESQAESNKYLALTHWTEGNWWFLAPLDGTFQCCSTWICIMIIAKNFGTFFIILLVANPVAFITSDGIRRLDPSKSMNPLNFLWKKLFKYVCKSSTTNRVYVDHELHQMRNICSEDVV